MTDVTVTHVVLKGISEDPFEGEFVYKHVCGKNLVIGKLYQGITALKRKNEE